MEHFTKHSREADTHPLKYTSDAVDGSDKTAWWCDRCALLIVGGEAVTFRRRRRQRRRAGDGGERHHRGGDPTDNQRSSAGVGRSALRHSALLAVQGRLGLDHPRPRPLHGYLHAVRGRLPARRGQQLSYTIDRRQTDDELDRPGTTQRDGAAVIASALRYRHICRHHVHYRHHHQLPHHIRRWWGG